MLRRADTRHFSTAKPAHPAFRSFPLHPAPQSGGESALRLRLVARHGRRLRKRIRQSPLQSGIGLLRRADTRLAFHCVCPMLSQACSATPVPGHLAHSPPSIGWFFISIPCKPNALAALGVVGSVSLPEVLYYARRTSSASPPFEQPPTSPNHEITTSGLAVISLAIVGKPTILKSGSQSVPRNVVQVEPNVKLA